MRDVALIFGYAKSVRWINQTPSATPTAAEQVGTPIFTKAGCRRSHQSKGRINAATES